MLYMRCLYGLLSSATLLSPGAAQQPNFTDLLANRSDLTQLSQFFTAHPDILQSSTNLTNFTFLAPNDVAFQRLANTSTTTQLSATNDTTFLQALFAYHAFNGTNTLTSVQDTVGFIQTNLNFYLTPDYSLYHGSPVANYLSPGKGIFFSSGLYTQSNVVVSNLTFDAGVVHIIDTFLTIPVNLTSTLNAFDLTAAEGAILDAGPELVLPRYITGFIPLNSGFQAVGSIFNNVSSVQLAEILAYHFVNSTYVVEYNTQSSSSALDTISGPSIDLLFGDGNAYINSAEVVVSNMLVLEGLINIIDNVLNPANTTIIPNYASSSQLPVWSGATPLSNQAIPFTSGIATPTSTILTLSPSPITANSTRTSHTASKSASSTASGMPTGGTRASGLSTGAKAGIGVGVAVGAIAILALVACLFLRRRRKSAPPQEIPHPVEPEMSPPEKDLAAELATKRDHAGELQGDDSRRQNPNTTATGIENMDGKPDEYTQELDGQTVGPELEGQKRFPRELGGTQRSELP